MHPAMSAMVVVRAETAAELGPVQMIEVVGRDGVNVDVYLFPLVEESRTWQRRDRVFSGNTMGAEGTFAGGGGPLRRFESCRCHQSNGAVMGNGVDERSRLPEQIVEDFVNWLSDDAPSWPEEVPRERLLALWAAAHSPPGPTENTDASSQDAERGKP
jgi:hypothetical protein